MPLSGPESGPAFSPTSAADGEAHFWLRPAQQADYAFTLALYMEGAEKHLSKIGRFDEKRLRGLYEEAFKPEQIEIICGDDREIGFIHVIEYPERLYLRQLHLVEGLRGRGIGTRLIEALFERAKNAGKPVTLEVLHGNSAKQLYLRLGFRVTGEDADKEHMVWEGPGTPRGFRSAGK